MANTGWLDEVVSAFQRLGGEARLTPTLYDDIEEHTKRPLTREWRAIVRRTIEEHSSDTETSTKRPNYADIFRSVDGIGKGVWALRGRALTDLDHANALEVITDETQVRESQAALVATFKANTRRRILTVGTPGESRKSSVYWSDNARIWGIFRDDNTKFWNAFGTTDFSNRSNDIVCEINPSLKSSRAPAGAFLLHRRSGEVYYAHRGMLGGTFQGKSTYFWRLYDGPVAIVGHGGYAERYAIISSIDDPDLVSNLAAFVVRVLQIKDRIRNDEVPPLRRGVERLDYLLEYTGNKRYQRGGYVLTRNTHALTANALASVLKNRPHNLLVRNTVAKDVEILDNHKNPRMLFEVKSTGDLQSIYTAVGQLFCNGKASNPGMRLALVVPEIDETMMDILKNLGIKVVLAEVQKGGEIRFDGLDSAIAGL